jgi:small subunit ribosomal protein S20
VDAPFRTAAAQTGFWAIHAEAPHQRLKRLIYMPNTPSAKKAMRKAERKAAINKTRRTSMRTYVRRVEEALAAGDVEAAKAAFKDAEPKLIRSGQKGIIHSRTASRKVSRLAKRLKALDASASA